MHKRRGKKKTNRKQGKISDLSTGQMLGEMEKIPSPGLLLTSPVSCRLNRYNLPRKPPATARPLNAHGPAPLSCGRKEQTSGLGSKPLHCSPAHGEAQYTECTIFMVTFLFFSSFHFLSKTVIQWTFSLGFLGHWYTFFYRSPSSLWYIPGRAEDQKVPGKST